MFLIEHLNADVTITTGN
uniref:Uncharacterized protein n=1 Tax=Anguilla anguilla TaxID=7936 RepID=A0A0E9PAK2_ANGAN